MKKIVVALLITLSFMQAQKIVVLEPSIVEIMYALHAEDNIVAISKMLHSNIWPKEKTEQLDNVGNYSKPNIEKILTLKPDLVIVNKYSSKTDEDLKRFKIKTTSFQANSLEEIYKNIKKVGTIVNKEKEATKFVDELKDRISKVASSFSAKGKKAVFFYSSAPLMAFNSKTLPGDTIKLLGMKNLSDELLGDRPIISQEFILVENPDVIFVMKGMSNTEDILRVNPLLKRTNAYKNNNIIFVDSASFLRGSQRIVDTIEELPKKIKN